jgi:gluconate 2-dehydrogenase alpha chain
MGFTGAILAKELADAGLSVVGLECGIWCDTVPDFQSPAMHDELRYAVRGDLFQNMAIEAMTFRNRPDQEALPMRSLGSFLPGTDVGGAGVHWNGQTWRFLPSDFVQRSHYLEKYGPNAIPAELMIQDWRVTYDALEPFYDRFECLCGICGKAGNLRGAIQPGGNPFEGPRSRDYPNPTTKPAYAGALFAHATVQLGYTPFQLPSANMTRPYMNFEGVSMQACTVCGFCDRFGCEHFAKAGPQTTILPKALSYPTVELRTRVHVTRGLLDSERKRATAVIYVDGEGQEVGQPYDPATGQGTVGALAYWSAQAIREQYLKSPGPLVRLWASPTLNSVPFIAIGWKEIDTWYKQC